MLKTRMRITTIRTATKGRPPPTGTDHQQHHRTPSSIKIPRIFIQKRLLGLRKAYSMTDKDKTEKVVRLAIIAGAIMVGIIVLTSMYSGFAALMTGQPMPGQPAQTMGPNETH